MMTSASAVALHEAAHAVVFARLSVPFVRVSMGHTQLDQVRLNPATGLYQHVRLNLAGGCLAEPAARGGPIRRLPEAQAVDALTRYAVGAAAGPAADQLLGADDLGASADRDELNTVAFLLGVGPTASSHAVQIENDRVVIPSEFFHQAIAEPEVKDWVEARVQDARELLQSDGEVAWRRVATELQERTVLSRHEVEALVDGSGAGSVGPP